MYHSLYFNDGTTTKNTWDDFHLIPSTRPNVEQPSVSYKYVDIPGKDGSLDLSTYLTGHVQYSDRSGSFTFYVMREDPDTNQPFPDNQSEWNQMKQILARYFTGENVLKMTLEDDGRYYYRGRFYFKTWSTGESYSQVTIEYRLDPYKYKVTNDEAVIG